MRQGRSPNGNLDPREGEASLTQLTFLALPPLPCLLQVRAEHFLSIEEINVRNDQLNRIKAAAMAADGSGGGKKVRTLYDRRPNAPSIVSVKKRMKGGAVPALKEAEPESPAKPDESKDPKVCNVT